MPRGLERLWNALSPYHEDTLIDRRAEALVDVWDQLKLPRQPQILAGE